MSEIVIDAINENLPQVLSFIEEQLDEAGCLPKDSMQIAIAAEEIFVNIASYAYKPGTGKATVRMEFCDEPLAVTITFMDSGIPFDPLKKKDPDVTLSAEERGIGGLGIFMTKKFMDDVRYEYSEGRNILTLKKFLTR